MKLKDFVDQHGVDVLARKTGLNRSTIYRHLSGARAISASAAVAYARAGMRLEDLLPIDSNEQRKIA